MSISLQFFRIFSYVETSTIFNEFFSLAKFIMSIGGLSKATASRRVISRDLTLGARFARIRSQFSSTTFLASRYKKSSLLQSLLLLLAITA